MLNIDREIAAWRVQARRRSTLTEDELDELEIHLRDAIDARIAAGQEPVAALASARERLGAVAGIDAEYRKVRLSPLCRDRLLWMLIGYVAFEGAQMFARLIATYTAGPGLAGWLDDSRAPLGLVLVHAVVIGALAAVIARGALRHGNGAPGRALLLYRGLVGNRWTAAAATGAALVAFLGSAIAINYWQWWTNVHRAEWTRALGFSNYWLDIFELALAPTLAVAAIVSLWSVGRRRDRQRRAVIG